MARRQGSASRRSSKDKHLEAYATMEPAAYEEVQCLLGPGPRQVDRMRSLRSGDPGQVSMASQREHDQLTEHVAKAQKMQANATGERRVPTDEEKAEFEKKKAAGELPAAREAFRKKVQGK